jgi:hypothetical protein
MHTHKFLVLLWSLAIVLFSSLALAEDLNKHSEVRLMERANAYWSALQARDFATMYGLEAGALDGRLSPDKLRNAVGRSRLMGYTFKGVKIEEDLAAIMVEATYNVAGIGGSIPNIQPDRWVFTEGDWYHAQGLRLNKKTGHATKQEESPESDSKP